MEQSVELTTDFIKLDALLKVAGIADSGGRAKHLIQEGLVRVNGEATTQRGKKIRKGDVIEVAVDPHMRVVVR